MIREVRISTPYISMALVKERINISYLEKKNAAETKKILLQRVNLKVNVNLGKILKRGCYFGISKAAEICEYLK